MREAEKTNRGVLIESHSPFGDIKSSENNDGNSTVDVCMSRHVNHRTQRSAVVSDGAHGDG